MRIKDSRIALISIFVLLALSVGIGPAVADGEKAEKKADSEDTTKKATTSAAKEGSTPPVSSIYRAAQEASAKKQNDDQSVVITNEDLERMMSGLTPEQKLQGVYQAERHIGAPAPAEAGESQQGTPEQGQKPDPTPESSLEWLKQREEAANERRSENVDLDKQVAELSAKVADLERRLLALRNPLLTRRYSTKKDEEVEDWDELDNVQRVETTQKELDDARAELAEAQAKLNRGRSTPR